MIDCVKINATTFQIMTDHEGVINMLGKKNAIGSGSYSDGDNGHIRFHIFSVNAEQLEMVKSKFELTAYVEKED